MLRSSARRASIAWSCGRSAVRADSPRSTYSSASSQPSVRDEPAAGLGLGGDRVALLGLLLRRDPEVDDGLHGRLLPPQLLGEREQRPRERPEGSIDLCPHRLVAGVETGAPAVGVDPPRRRRPSRAGGGARLRLARLRAAASRGMSGRQGAESGRGGGGGDPAPMAGIGVGEVAAEASSGPVEVAGSGRQFDQGESLAVGRHVLPRLARATPSSVSRSSLATYSGNELASDPETCRLADRRAEGRSRPPPRAPPPARGRAGSGTR